MRNPFDAVDPVGTKTQVSGATERLRPLDYDERVVVVLEATVRSAGVKPSGDGPIWVQALKAGDFYLLDGPLGAAVLDKLRAERRSAEDQAAGIEVLPGFDGVTDASGVVVTPGDEADLAGEEPELPDENLPTPDTVTEDEEVINLPPESALEKLTDDARAEYEALLLESDDATGHSRRELLLQADALVAAELGLVPGDRIFGAYVYRAPDPAPITDVEPFDGYADAKVDDVKGFIDAVIYDLGPQGTTPAAHEGAAILSHVLAYETAHKARKGILAHLSWITDTPAGPDADPNADAEADFIPDDEDAVDPTDEFAVDPTEDLGDAPDDELELGDFEPTDDEEGTE